MPQPHRPFRTTASSDHSQSHVEPVCPSRESLTEGSSDAHTGRPTLAAPPQGEEQTLVPAHLGLAFSVAVHVVYLKRGQVPEWAAQILQSCLLI